jgi:hypothetical protein
MLDNGSGIGYSVSVRINQKYLLSIRKITGNTLSFDYHFNLINSHESQFRWLCVQYEEDLANFFLYQKFEPDLER